MIIITIIMKQYFKHSIIVMSFITLLQMCVSLSSCTTGDNQRAMSNSASEASVFASDTSTYSSEAVESISNQEQIEAPTSDAAEDDYVAEDFGNKDDQDNKYDYDNNNSTAPTSYSKFVGTYKFSWLREGRFNQAPIVVLEDGRCLAIYVTVGGDLSPKYLGKVTPISNNAFKIVGGFHDTKYGCDLNIYKNGRDIGNTIKGTNLRNCIFDISEGKLYRSKTEYENRDIVDPEYTPFTHSSSTAY